jgi:CelD/BcsL family acetyltransferase involved in cellulose biosynthesis
LSIRVIKPQELSRTEIGAWRRVQDGDPHLGSPFFSPEFTHAVGSARGDAFVGVIESGGKIAGFFPFQRHGRVGQPIGAAICDYQGLIAEGTGIVTAGELLAGCRLDALDFNHVPAVQTIFHEHSILTSYSPYIDLEAGYPAFVARRKQQGVQEVGSTLRKLRKLEREMGPVRFVADDADGKAWQKLIAWKNAQYRRSNLVEALDRDWISVTLSRIREEKGESFSGLLSSLCAGDNLLAVHFGMRRGAIWHYWFPAYDTDFNRYSPGLILLLKMAEYGAANGIKMIDLGRGQTRYKTAFADGEVQLCEGSLQRAASVAGALRLGHRAVERAWGALPVGAARDWPRRLFNRLIWRP